MASQFEIDAIAWVKAKVTNGDVEDASIIGIKEDIERGTVQTFEIVGEVVEKKFRLLKRVAGVFSWLVIENYEYGTPTEEVPE